MEFTAADEVEDLQDYEEVEHEGEVAGLQAEVVINGGVVGRTIEGVGPA